MKNRDVISSLFWIGFALIFTIGGLQIGLVRQGIPGPGSLPFIVGLILLFLSLLVLIPAIMNKRVEKEKFFPQKNSLKKLILALAALFAYGFFFKTLGFMVTTLLFMIFVLRFIEPQKWTTVLTFSVLIALVAHILFAALQVELPRGIFGI